MHRHLRRRPVTVAALIAALTSPVAAQTDNPVYVDDSPQAWLLFQQARDQVRDNVGEAARLYQELLSEFGLKLIPVVETDGTMFASVRSRVLRDLAGQPALLDRYRLIETAAAQRLLDEDMLERAAATRPLTAPGLEAMLRLGQRHLEAGSFRMALHWLDEAAGHPDVDETRAAHLWHMTGMAAHYLRDDALLQEALTKLSGLPAAGEILEHMVRLHAGGAGPLPRRGVTPLDTAPASDLSQLIAEDIWSVDLEDSLLNRRFASTADDGGQSRDAREQRRRRGQLNTAAPTIAGEVVFINEGHTVRALDRFTGRAVWPQPYAETRGAVPEDGNSELTMDMNIVSVEGDALVTFTGHLMSRERSNDGRVVCLDAVTGALRWWRDISHIDGADEFETLFPHGRPLIIEGSVYFMARKARKQQLTAAYVIALDLQTGALRWARHVSTSGGIRNTARPFSAVAFDRGSLFVATPLGAVARLELHDGEIRWLKRYPVPLNATQSAMHRPWEFDQPVVVGDRVIAIEPDRRRVVVIDRESGDETSSHACASTDGWGAPSYLLANEHSVYGVGRDIAAFRLGDLNNAAWRLSRPAESPIQNESSFDRRPEIGGRVQLVGSQLVAPTYYGVLIVDNETGVIDAELDIPYVGNPVAFDSQLLLAEADRLDAYMSFDRAREMLRQRIASNPGDPDPALSLLKLGVRVRDFDLSMQAANLVVEALDRATFDDKTARARDELFARLLEIDERGIASTRDQGELLFGVLNSIADSPAARIEYLLAYGSWLGQHSPRQAIERGYQAILSDPKLAATWRRHDDAVRRAADWAADRQRRLIHDHGRAVYAAQDDFALLRLDQIRAGADPDPDELIALVQEFPLASVAVEAAFLATEQCARQGRFRKALGVLGAMDRLNPEAPETPRLLGRYLSLCAAAGWTDDPVRTLRSVIGTRPALAADTDEGSRLATDLLDELAPRSRRALLPEIELPLGNALFLSGGLVRLHTGARWTLESVLLADDGALKLYPPGRDEPVWTTTIDAAEARILHADPGRLLLWNDPSENGDDPRALMLDSMTGTVRWTSASVAEHLGEPLREPRGGAGGRRGGGQEFDPRHTWPLFDGDRLILVRGAGGILALSALDGQTVRWTRHDTIAQVHHAALHDGAVILAGMMHKVDALGGTTARAPRIVAYDAATGESLWQRETLGDGEVRWMTPGPFGTLAIGTSTAVELLDSYGGRRLWASVAPGARDSLESWMLPDRVLVRDRESRLRTLALADGRLSPPFDLSFRRDLSPADLREVLPDEHGVATRFRNHMIRFDFDGKLIGMDAISDATDFQWLIPARSSYVVINAQVQQVPVNGQAARRTEYSYLIHFMSDNGRLLGDPYSLPRSDLVRRLQDARLIGSTLYLSTRDLTFGIPVSPAR